MTGCCPDWVPQCTATSKRTGVRCKANAVRGWNVCRNHGAGGGRKPTNGLYTKASIEQRREVRQLIDASRKLMQSLDS